MFYVYADDKLLYHPLEETLVITSPRLSLEIGKAGTFQFELPPTNKYYNSLQILRTRITVEIDGTEIFRGRVLSTEKNFYNVRSVYCEGDLSYLVDSVQKAEKYSGTTHDLFRKIVAAHNARVEADKQFEVGQITIEDQPITLTGPSDEIEDEAGNTDYKQIVINSIANEWRTSYDYIESCLISYTGGYLRTRRVGNTTYLDLVTDYGNTAQQEIEFGMNMLDLTEEVTAEELFTVLIPLGDDGLTIASVNNGSDELADTKAVELYGRIVKTHSFESVNKAETLLENAKAFLANHVNLPVTLTIKAVDMHLVDQTIPEIHVGDSVQVKSSPHGITKTLTCTKIEYDFDDVSNNTYTFGTPKQTLTEQYRKDKSPSSGGGSGSYGDSTPDYNDIISDVFDDVIKETENKNNDLDNKLTEDINKVKDDVVKVETVLKNAGIDTNSSEAPINISQIKTVQDEQGNIIKDIRAQITSHVSETDASLELLTQYCSSVEDKEAKHYASITLRANELESAIEMKADKVTVDALQIDLTASQSKLTSIEDELNNEVKVNISTLSERTDDLGNRVSASETNITSLANDTEAKISAVATRTSGAETRIASLEVRADDLESSIDLKADRVTVNSKISSINSDIVSINSDITNINSEITNVKKLIANDISAIKADISWLEAKNLRVSSLSANTVSATEVRGTALYMGSALVATQAWVKSLLDDYSKTTHTHRWDDITGKPNRFPSVAHNHKFSVKASLANGHTHKVTVDGKTYTTQGVSTNTYHDLSFSGTTQSN